MALMPGFRRLFQRPTPEVRQDVDAELEMHLEMKARELIDDGLGPEEAHREARRRFGNLASIRRQCVAAQSRIARVAARNDWIGALLGDLRYAVRTLRRSPGFTAVVMLSLALGIGATSTIFSALNPILLRPLPFADPDRLVHISENSAERPDARRVPFHSTYLEWKEHNSVFEQLEFVGSYTEMHTFSAIDGAERNAAQWVSPGLFRLLGVEPILGRHFGVDDKDGEHLILSYGFWQRRFGGDPDIIGQTLVGWEGGGAAIVVGVMPPGFRIFSWNEADFWYPNDTETLGVSRWMEPIGRLKGGVSKEGAQTQLDAIARRLDESGVSAESGWRVRVDPLHEYASERFTSNLYLLMGAAVLLLLIACSNVASILVGRATNRHREITTRAALGAGRLRLIRQLLTESVVLALFGGALGGTDGARGHEALRHPRSDLVPTRGGDPRRRNGSRLHAGTLAVDRDSLRDGSCAPGVQPRSGQIPQARREGLPRGIPPPSPESAGWITDRAHPGAPGRRGPDGQQLRSAGGRRSGLQSGAPIDGPSQLGW